MIKTHSEHASITLLIAVVFVVGGAGAVAGASAADVLERGAVTERVASLADPSKSYAVYLPSAYEEDRTWPVLILMDPRGRALVPLELFRAVAEDLGWIVVSSYDTLSDSTWEPNDLAMGAMIADIPERFAADSRRVYLAGMSGTARGIWNFADRLQPYVAGVIAFAGGKLDWIELPTDPDYRFFGATGYTDDNFGEMFRLDEELDGLGVVHRVVYFPGGHEWGTEQVCRDAARWFEIQAMISGLRPVDADLAATWIDEEVAHAEALEREGRPWNAWRAYAAIAEQYAEIAGADVLAGALEGRARLESEGRVHEVEQRVRKHVDDEGHFRARLAEFFEVFYRDPRGLDTRTALWRLGLDRALVDSEEAPDHVEAEAAQRLLQVAFTHMAFYMPRDYLDHGDFKHALAMLEIADGIRPDQPVVLYFRARSYAALGRLDEAVEALERGTDIGLFSGADAEGFEGDEDLLSLRDHPRFQSLLERLRGEEG